MRGGHAVLDTQPESKALGVNFSRAQDPSHSRKPPIKYQPMKRSRGLVADILLLISVIFTIVITRIPGYGSSRFAITAYFVTPVLEMCHMRRTSALRFRVLLAPHCGDGAGMAASIFDVIPFTHGASKQGEWRDALQVRFSAD